MCYRIEILPLRSDDLKVTRLEYTIHKYEKHFPKMLMDVRMAVPKTTETRCRDGTTSASSDVDHFKRMP